MLAAFELRRGIRPDPLQHQLHLRGGSDMFPWSRTWRRRMKWNVDRRLQCMFLLVLPCTLGKFTNKIFNYYHRWIHTFTATFFVTPVRIRFGDNFGPLCGITFEFVLPFTIKVNEAFGHIDARWLVQASAFGFGHTFTVFQDETGVTDTHWCEATSRLIANGKSSACPNGARIRTARVKTVRAALKLKKKLIIFWTVIIYYY